MWGKFDNLKEMPTPAGYLKEQAEYLGDATNQILQGEIVHSAQNNRFETDLDIVVPNLNYYRHTLLRVIHPVSIYPLEIHDFANEDKYTCEDESSFLDRLERILSSRAVRKIIETLISQSRTFNTHPEWQTCTQNSQYSPAGI